MRTTLTIDDDVLARARQLAHASDRSIGDVVSELARRGLGSTEPSASRSGLRLLPSGRHGRRATLEEVNRLRDELP